MEDVTHMIWSRYTLGLQKAAEYVIWNDMLSIMHVTGDNIVKEIETIMFEG